MAETGTSVRHSSRSNSVRPFFQRFSFSSDVGNGTFEPGTYGQPIATQGDYQRGYGTTGPGP